jgi:AraC-like DNA-binding protein
MLSVLIKATNKLIKLIAAIAAIASFDVGYRGTPMIVVIATALIAEPDDRRTLGEWASHVAMNERSFKRLMLQETGLTLG